MKKNQKNKSAEYSDQQLLDEYLRKYDLEILGALFERYLHLVYGLCLKYLNNREDSQDAVMQIFEVVIRDISKTTVHNFKSWLYVVSKNYCLMQLRRDAKLQGKSETINDETFMESTPVLHPIDEEDQENIVDALEACLKKLKEEQKVCVELFYYQQKCYKEIAAVLNTPEKKVKSLLQNGKRNLKICIEATTEVNESKH